MGFGVSLIIQLFSCLELEVVLLIAKIGPVGNLFLKVRGCMYGE